MAGKEGRDLTAVAGYNTAQEVLEASHFKDGEGNTGLNVFPLGFRAPKTPTIYNILIDAVNWTEVSIPEGCCSWLLQCRSSVDVYYSYSASALTYMTLKADRVLSEDTDIYTTKIYLKASSGTPMIELEVWQS